MLIELMPCPDSDSSVQCDGDGRESLWVSSQRMCGHTGRVDSCIDHRNSRDPRGEASFFTFDSSACQIHNFAAPSDVASPNRRGMVGR
jgi:hypothetical protein